MHIPFFSKRKDSTEVRPKFFSWNIISHRLLGWWLRHGKQILFSLFVLSVAGAAYMWYYDLHLYTWDDAKKESYRSDHFQETLFKKDTFEKALQSEQARKTAHESDTSVSKDIFLGN